MKDGWTIIGNLKICHLVRKGNRSLSKRRYFLHESNTINSFTDLIISFNLFIITSKVHGSSYKIYGQLTDFIYIL